MAKLLDICLLTLQYLLTFDLMPNISRMSTGTVHQIVQSLALLKPSDRSQHFIEGEMQNDQSIME